MYLAQPLTWLSLSFEPSSACLLYLVPPVFYTWPILLYVVNLSYVSGSAFLPSSACLTWLSLSYMAQPVLCIRLSLFYMAQPVLHGSACLKYQAQPVLHGLAYLAVCTWLSCLFCIWLLGTLFDPCRLASLTYTSNDCVRPRLTMNFPT
jgi:hypothetical protein